MTVEVSAGAALLGSPVRRSIVDALSRQGSMTAAKVGEIIDLHVTTARFHLDQLVAGGLLESSFEKQAGAGRPKKVYTVAEGSLAASSNRETEGLNILAGLLAESFSAAEHGHPVTPAEAGRHWAQEHIPPTHAPRADTAGRWLSKVGEMVDVLGEWGYTPEVATTNAGRTARINLAHCPFIDLARQNPAVVCGIHRGLITGAMAQLGEDGAEVSLEPFVTPVLCRAHVTTHHPFRATTSGVVSGDPAPEKDSPAPAPSTRAHATKGLTA